jgi:hypothetical protein
MKDEECALSSSFILHPFMVPAPDRMSSELDIEVAE